MLSLDDTAEKLRRLHAALPQTRPPAGRTDTGAAIAGTLATFPAALGRISARLGAITTIVDGCVTRFEGAWSGPRRTSR